MHVVKTLKGIYIVVNSFFYYDSQIFNWIKCSKLNYLSLGTVFAEHLPRFFPIHDHEQVAARLRHSTWDHHDLRTVLYF